LLCCVIKELSISPFSISLLPVQIITKHAETESRREGKKEKQTNIIKKFFAKSRIDPLPLNFYTQLAQTPTENIYLMNISSCNTYCQFKTAQENEML